jgi:indole-3-glycerol phosphate synthase
LKFHPVLQKILDEKKKEIDFIQEYKEFNAPIYSLKESLHSKTKSLITECKKGSPSSGVLRESYNPIEIAKLYEECGVGGISVLTDRNFFYGDILDLQNVSHSVKIPVLRKDFIIHKLQIQEARFMGASAILLIARILSDLEMKELYGVAKSLGMDVLLETHTIEEAKRALELGADIIGINTRDLDTFTILPKVVSEIASYLPSHVLKVGESGIQNSKDLKEMFSYVDSALVGTYFMKSEDIKKAYKELVAPIEG